MNLKSRKNRGLTLALMILAACMICLLVPTMSVSAKAKKKPRSGEYYFFGNPYKNGSRNGSRIGKIKIKSKKLTIQGGYLVYPTKNGDGRKLLKKKKRKYVISKKCRYYLETNTGVGCVKCVSKKTFIKLSKKWVKNKGKKLTSGYDALTYKVKKGKVVELSIGVIPAAVLW